MVSNGAFKLSSAGETLIQESRDVDSMFLIIDGSYQVTVGSRAIAKLQAGEIIGEMSLVDSRPPSASVRALEKSSVLCVPRTKLSERLERDVPFAARFYRALSLFLAERLRTSISQLGYGSAAPTREEINDRDELDAGVVENLSLASNRFDALQRRLRSVGTRA